MEQKTKKYRDAAGIDQEMVKRFLEGKGYEVLEIQQIWRHVHAKLKKDDKIFFFKMASTKEIGVRTANEVSWNKQLRKIIEEKGIKYFTVPDVYETGEIDGNFYYIGEYFPGKQLANKKDLSGLENWMDKIVQTVFFLSGIEHLELSRDVGRKVAYEDWDSYYKKIKGWYDIADNPTLEPLLKRLEDLKTTYQRGLSHGDFVPWHMIEDGNRFVLIDGEHGTALWPRYYDVAYFYHRMYVSADSPEMGELFLKKVKELLPEGRAATFDKEFLPILATRIIGGFFELKISTEKHDDKYYEILKERFLRGEI